MKVAILTMFNGLSSTYSLVNVVAEHLRMLLDANINVKLLVTQHCPDNDKYGVFLDKRIEWIKITNEIDGKIIHWKDYSKEKEVHDKFFKESEIIANDFVKYLADVEVCIMHDILYQGWHLIHNVAIRKAQKKLPNIKFIAFTHSAPANRPKNIKWPFSARFTPMPNTIYVYPTKSGITALAKQYNVSEKKCKVVNNTLDLTSFLNDDVKNVIEKTNLLSADIIVVYPGRLTASKKFDKVALLGACIKRVSSLNVKIVFCDFPSIDIDSAKYKAAVEIIGLQYGLNEEDIIFTSEIGYPYGFPRSGVMELFSLSNLFICPSFSESFGLTVLEAASKGNFLVVNEAVPALKELGKKLNAYFMRWDARNFGFDTKEDYHPSEVDYMEEHAIKILKLMKENPVIFAKTLSRLQFSPKWVWENQLRSLLVNKI